MGRRKRAPSRIASQLQALQNVGKLAKANKEREKKIENKLALVDLRVKPKLPPAVAKPPSLNITQAPPREPQQGDVITDGSGARYLMGAPRTDEQGRITQEKFLLPPPKAAPADAPKPVEVEAAPQVRDKDARPPWLQRGDSQPRNKAEWLAWQTRRTQSGMVYVQPHGPNHPGYLVPMASESRMLPLPGLSGPNGIREPGGEISTLWNRSLSGL